MNKRAPLQPLGGFGMLFLPLLLLFNRGINRERIIRRAEKKRSIIERKKAERQLKKELKKESKVYEKLIIDCWTRLGEAHLARQRDVSTNGKPPKKRKVQRVRFARCFTSPERIMFQIAINQRTVMGSSINLLPQHVRVADLLSKETVFELGMACQRMVVAQQEDARKGAWIIVNRLEGFDGVPTYVTFNQMLPIFDQKNIGRGPIQIGIGEHRKDHQVYLASHPHVLIGGSSGGGKSNMVNHIIASLMRFSDPQWTKFILIDLKRMEFGLYKDSPHLLRPVVFEAEEAVKELKFLVSEIARRAELLSGKAKELADWNSKFPSKAMPRIILVIDEFAELMLASGREIAREVENYITRGTNLGRAVGVHFIIATQRPAVDVLPNKIKVNMPLIISARVPNAAQSAVILGDSSASKLPMLPGRMLYLSGSTRAIIQAPHVQDDDVIESVRIARGRSEGIIRLNGPDAEIVPEQLTIYIADCLQGSLSPEKLWHHLRDRGVPGRQLKAYLGQLIKMGRVQVGERYFIVESYRNGWRLTEPYQEPAPEPEPVEFMLPAGLPALSKSIEIAAEDVITPAPIEYTPEQRWYPKDSTELVQAFIRDCCNQGRTSKEVVAVLYSHLCAYCDTHDLDHLTKRTFGEILTQLGFKSAKGTAGTRYKLGLSLLPVVEAQAAEVA